MLDAGDTVVESALIYLGRNPDSENPDDLKAAIDVITKIQPYVRYFHSTSYVDDLANGEICLAIGYSGDVLQATRSARPGVKIDYFLPKEGASRLDRRNGDSERRAAPGRRGEVDRSHPRPDRRRRYFQRGLYANPNKPSRRCSILRSVTTRSSIPPPKTSWRGSS